MTFDYSAGADWNAVGEAELADVVELRRAIHADPEVGLDCVRTTAKIKAALAGLPLEFREGPSTSGLIAILRCGIAGAGNANGRTVLLRGDMDALPMTEETGLDFASQTPGKMHACGHDAHTAMLVGAAKALSARREELSGTIVFMFQPGEEGYHGARYMIQDGLLDDPAPEAAFAFHILPTAPAGMVIGRAGPMMASTDTLRATIKGKGGHAAMPHQCIDPIPVAAEIVTALQTYVARQVAVQDPAVLSITKIEAGSSHNIVPESVAMLGTLRTLSKQTREQMRAAFQRICEHVALAHGATAEATIEEGYPVTIADPRAVALMERVANGLAAGSWHKMPSPMMGAEDFSYVLDRIPGGFAFLGVAPEGTDAASNPPLHNTKMVIDEAVMAKGVALHCAVAERFLNHGFDA